MKYSVVDIETTGFSHAQGDRITEVAIVHIENGVVVDRYSTLINPQRSIPFDVVALTGISDAMVRTAPLFSEVAGEIASRLVGTISFAHNASFDVGFLNAEFRQAGWSGEISALCTVMLSRRLHPNLPNGYSLGALVQHFKLKKGEAHRALSDALMTADLLVRHLSTLRTHLPGTEFDAELLFKINLEPPKTFQSGSVQNGLQTAIARRRRKAFLPTRLSPGTRPISLKPSQPKPQRTVVTPTVTAKSIPVETHSTVSKLHKPEPVAPVRAAIVAPSSGPDTQSSNWLWWAIGIGFIIFVMSK